MATDVFSVPVFLICFRESLECAIIVSVLLAFLKQTLDGPADEHNNRDAKVYKKLVRQVWLGVGLGFLICLVVAGAVIGTFYTLGGNRWEGTEKNWEGAFALIAAVIISIVGVAILRIGKMQEKWRVKIAAALDDATLMPTAGDVEKKKGKRGWTAFKRFSEKYAMFMLPFVTVLREGIEAIVFIAGVTFTSPATAVPLAVIIGLLVGIICGYLLYKGGSTTKLRIFLTLSTCLLYLVAAGLFSRAVGDFEQQQWNNLVGGDAGELGDGPGSYDIDKSVWHVNCCSPELNGGGGWGFFNAILGWTNSATYGTVISYNVYWIFIISVLITLRFRELNGHWPLMKRKASAPSAHDSNSQRSGNGVVEDKTVA